MTIPSLSAPTGAQAPLKNSSAQLQATIASLVSGQISSNGNDVADLSIASQLQSESNGLRQASENLAQGSSLLQVASGGATQIQDILGQLQTLAQQAASPAVNADTRQQLNQQFQQLSDEVDAVATGTSFNGQSLLDGSLSGANALSLESLTGGNSSSDGVSIGNLSSQSLLGSNTNILSTDSASQAFDTIGNAINQVTGVNAGIGALQQTVDFAAANVDSALANQEAARSSIQDTDFATASTQYALANVQQNSSIALIAQGNNLSPTLLQLIG